MDLKEKFTVFCLAAFDRLMDLISFRQWTRIRGDVVPNIRLKTE